MSAEQNKKLVTMLFNDVMNKKEFSLISKIFALQFVNHGIPGAQPGPDGFLAVIKQFQDGFPDMKITVEDAIAEGDRVCTRGHWTGTHKGNFMGIGATGKKVKVDYIDIWKVKDGKLIENWVQMDMSAMMQQLGIVPEAAAH